MQKHNPKIYFSILDEKGFLGALSVICDNTLDPYRGELFDEAMFVVKKMLYHYNKEIITQKDSLPRLIYALRILERRGINPSKGVLVPEKTKATEKELLSYKGRYELSQSCIYSQKITLDHEEAQKWAIDHTLKVFIDLKQNQVKFHRFSRWFDVNEYCKHFEKSEEDFWEFMNEATYYPASWKEFTLSEFGFNYIDEVEKLAKDNKNGFKDDAENCMIRLR